MHKHTPGKIHSEKGSAGTHLMPNDGTDTTIAYLKVAFHKIGPDTQSANAQRLVDCWNACEPFDNPTEAIPVMIGALKEFVADVEAVGIEQVNSDWPDLAHSYKSARRALSLINKPK